MNSPTVKAFFDAATYTVSYVVSDPETAHAVIIDPILDFDVTSGRTSTKSAERLLDACEHLQVDWILETHVHADHLSAAEWLKDKTAAAVVVSSRIGEVQKTFAPIFNDTALSGDGSEFDRLVDDGDSLSMGNLSVTVIATPGHTPACVTYQIGDAAFVGDTMFMPDYGTARCDFPGGNAAQLYDSIHKTLSLPEETRLFMCHDYKAPGRDVFAWETTVAEQLASNVHIGGSVSREDFTRNRETKDAGLSFPRLLIPALQVNLRAGQPPPAEDNGEHYLKIPLNSL